MKKLYVTVIFLLLLITLTSCTDFGFDIPDVPEPEYTAEILYCKEKPDESYIWSFELALPVAGTSVLSAPLAPKETYNYSFGSLKLEKYNSSSQNITQRDIKTNFGWDKDTYNQKLGNQSYKELHYDDVSLLFFDLTDIQGKEYSGSYVIAEIGERTVFCRPISTKRSFTHLWPIPPGLVVLFICFG